MKQSIKLLILVLAVFLLGCTVFAKTTIKKSTKHTTSTMTTMNTDDSDTTMVAPDNTKKNKRDRNTNNPTSGSQGNSKSDLKVTQQIRKEVVARKDLSTNAHNVKIITKNGKVTLRGPVKTSEEKTAIEDIAKNIAGAGNVSSDIEVKE